MERCARNPRDEADAQLFDSLRQRAKQKIEIDKSKEDDLRRKMEEAEEL